MHSIASTKYYPYTDFKPHGLVEFYQRQNTLFTTAVGPFNEEIIDALSFTQQTYIEKIIAEHGDWCELVEFENSCMATPGALEKLMMYLADLKRQNSAPKKTAFIIKEGLEGGNLLSNTYCNLYKKTGMTMQIFKSKTAALNWLSSETTTAIA